MQTVCFTTTAKIRRPSPKVVDLEDYRHKLAEPAVEVAPAPAAPAPRRSLRRRLRNASLVLDLCLTVCALALTVLAFFQLLRL